MCQAVFAENSNIPNQKESTNELYDYRRRSGKKAFSRLPWQDQIGKSSSVVETVKSRFAAIAMSQNRPALVIPPSATDLEIPRRVTFF